MLWLPCQPVFPFPSFRQGHRLLRPEPQAERVSTCCRALSSCPNPAGKPSDFFTERTRKMLTLSIRLVTLTRRPWRSLSVPARFSRRPSTLTTVVRHGKPAKHPLTSPWGDESVDLSFPCDEHLPSSGPGRRDQGYVFRCIVVRPMSGESFPDALFCARLPPSTSRCESMVKKGS